MSEVVPPCLSLSCVPVLDGTPTHQLRAEQHRRERQWEWRRQVSQGHQDPGWTAGWAVAVAWLRRALERREGNGRKWGRGPCPRTASWASRDKGQGCSPCVQGEGSG